MRIPIYCEHCHEVIDMFDTDLDVDNEWAKAPCGEFVCEACCEECSSQFDSYHPCTYRLEAR